MNLSGRTALVTGTARGLGRSLAMRLDVDPDAAAARIIRAVERERTRLVISRWYAGVLGLGRILTPLARLAARISYRKWRAPGRGGETS